MYEPLTSFLLRAPLLPERALGDAGALEEHALGAAAIALASGDLAGAADSAGRRRALGRYARRAAFRPTPHGLLAGVCVGELGPRTRITTGAAAAVLAPTWARMAALGRALLDEPRVRARARLRAAPSVVRAQVGGTRWIGPGQPFGEAAEAAPDARLAAVLDAAAGWTTWASARRACLAARDGTEGATEDADELLLLMIDQGLLQSDLTPPLIGPPPATWMRERLGALGRAGDAAALGEALRALEAAELEAGRAALAALPGGGGEARSGAGVHGVLTLRPRRPPVLARAAVERAATLAPLLFRLQEALAPPALERAAQRRLWRAVEAVDEMFGAGAVDLGELEGGGYGVEIGDEDEDEDGDEDGGDRRGRVLTVLVDALMGAVAEGREEAELDVAALDEALPDAEAPGSCELFLAPVKERKGAAPGTGWLLGLHGPAGASWGRFAGALGDRLERALDELAAAERAARPFEERLDVAFAPSPALADLCTHPPARRRTLAVSTWSAEEVGRDVTPADLELVAPPGLPPALRARDGDATAPLCPSPLARVRSTTAPAGVARLLVGWSLQRQHAPWALAAGPLAGLARSPRVSLGGFVIAPASWRIPPDLRDGRTRAGALARWRRAAAVPRWVQVGDEDQLLPVDLEAAGAAGDLSGRARAWEIWPPLGDPADRDGRRVEAVVALVDRPDPARAAELAGAARAAAATVRVPPPREAPPLPGWRTFKLYGPTGAQDALLVELVAPLARAARRAREIASWHVLRYVDGGAAPRPHLRLRVAFAGASAAARARRSAFEARLEAALAPFRAAGAISTVETADYHPESARFGGSAAALRATHAAFEAQSALVCALLGDEEAAPLEHGDRLARLVQSLDALARGLGFDLAARHALARARRDAEERLGGSGRGDDDGNARAARDRAFRARARFLRVALGEPPSGALAAHAAAVSRATARLPPDARRTLAAPLAHLACVRLWGPDRDAELDAYTFWERTLEGLLRAPPRARDARRP